MSWVLEDSRNNEVSRIASDGSPSEIIEGLSYYHGRGGIPWSAFVLSKGSCKPQGNVPVRALAQEEPRRILPRHSQNRHRKLNSAGSQTSAWSRSSPFPKALPFRNARPGDTCNAGKSFWGEAKMQRDKRSLSGVRGQTLFINSSQITLGWKY